MHTKHSHLLHIRKAAAMLCAALFLCACNYERIPDDSGEEQDGEFITVTLSVGTATGQQSLTTKGATDDEQNSINDIYILAFQAEDDQLNDFRLKYYATGRPESSSGGSKKFTFTLRRSFKADTKLLLVANQNPYSKVNINDTYDDVQKTLLSDVLTSAPTFPNGMPMIGFAENTTDALQISNEITSLSANLLRPVARVDVGVGSYNNETGEWTKGDVDFVLTEVHVFKPQNQYSLLPLMNNLVYSGQDIPSRTPSVNNPSQVGDLIESGDNSGAFIYKDGDISTNTSGATYCEAKIYLPEVNFEGGKVYDVPGHTNRMALVIGGLYKEQMNYYRIDFTNASTNIAGTKLENVLRNRIYRYTISSVNQPGYTTADAAYKGKPISLGLKADIVDWVGVDLDSPTPDMFVRLNYKGINGTDTTATMYEGSLNNPQVFTILKKKDHFDADGGKTFWSPLPYNDLRGEVKDNIYNGYGNGGMYKSVQDALNREGPFSTLIIAPDNATDETGVAWRSKDGSKKDRILDAKKACWDYRGQGQSDWRLPRLSELMLLWMNKETINSTKGFTSLGEGEVTYWTGTEGDPYGNKDASTAYTVSKKGVIMLDNKINKHLVRCVREVRNQSK